MTKTIASIYFVDVEAKRPLYGGYYRIPAIKKGSEPFLLRVDDKIQRSQEPGPDGKTKVSARYPVDARDIADDILREWTRETVGMTPDCRPGIWIVRDEVPVTDDQGRPEFDADKRPMWRPATDTERAEMWAEDLAAARIANANWADYLIRQGDLLADDPKQRILISGPMKIAARYFGRDREWLEELKDNDIKHCPYCTKAIAVHTVKCPHCQEVVDVEKYAKLQAQRDAAVEAARSEPVRPPVVAARQSARV